MVYEKLVIIIDFVLKLEFKYSLIFRQKKTLN